MDQPSAASLHPPLILAIDGPAGSGKSTTARLVAERLGYTFVDTGAMYRAVAFSALRAGIEDPSQIAPPTVSLHHEADGMHVLIDGEDVTAEIRTPAVGEMASRISTSVEVRRKLVDVQRGVSRKEVEQGRGVVLEGRDIGTVVFPDADLKFFMVARPEVRAQRRRAELESRGLAVTLEEVMEEMLRRDRQDTEREASPLRQAADAVVLDTSDYSIDQQVGLIVDARKGTTRVLFRLESIQPGTRFLTARARLFCGRNPPILYNQTRLCRYAKGGGRRQSTFYTGAGVRRVLAARHRCPSKLYG